MPQRLLTRHYFDFSAWHRCRRVEPLLPPALVLHAMANRADTRQNRGRRRARLLTRRQENVARHGAGIRNANSLTRGHEYTRLPFRQRGRLARWLKLKIF